ncbi:MAG: cobalamin-binding protein [Kiritimatiellae bacterium]|nr:cobalamin-binding protein [Kiritimatiellia bacterium]
MPKIIIAVCFSIFIGTHILAEDTAPKRIISLAPSYDETLIELGLKDRIVGVTTSSDYLEEVKHAARIGVYAKPNIEKIVALKPDLVLATGFAGQQSADDKLSALGLHVIVLDDTQGIEEIFATTRQIGDILGIPARTEALLKRMRGAIATARRLTETLPARPRVYLETGCDPLFTCGKGSFIHEMIEIAGGKNIAGDISQPFPRISSEFVINRDPEVIILPYMGRNFGKEALKQRQGWEKIAAIKTGRVYDDIGSQVITIPSPRLILYGLPALQKRIHQESIQGTNEE